MTRASAPPLSFKIALLANTAIGPAATQLFVPAVPAIATEFDVPIGIAQISFSAAMVAMAVSMLVYGPLSDRYGRMPMLFAGLFLFMAGTAVSLAAGNVTVLIVGRVVQAIGGAAGMVISRAVVRDLYGAEGAARVLGTLIVAAIAAPMLAIVLGGVITDLLGWRWIFILSLALGAVVAVLAWTILRGRETATRSAGRMGDMLRGYARLFRSPVYTGFVLQGGFGSGSFFSFMAVGPFLMVDSLHRPASEFGIYFAIVTLVFMGGNFTGSRISARLGLERMVVLGGILSVIATVCGLALFEAMGLSVLLMFGTSMFGSFGNGLAMPNSQAGALNVLPELAGTASGAAAFVQTIFGAMFAQIVASIVEPDGAALFVIMAVAAVLALLSGSVPALVKRRQTAPGVAGE